MNPNRGGEQPAPHFEFPSQPNSENYDEESERVAEQLKTPEAAPSTQPASPILPVVTAVPDTPVASGAAAPADDVAGTSSTPAADDKDRIERQWVEKAKSIIAQTRDDPFIQKNEMSKIKAAYIEKRFNKKMKTDDAIV